MSHQFTPAAERALDAAARWRGDDDNCLLDLPEVLLGLLNEPECRAAMLLAARGIDGDAVRRQFPRLALAEPDRARTVNGFAHPLKAAVRCAERLMSDGPGPPLVATEHLLLGMLLDETETSRFLIDRGFDPATLEAEIRAMYGIVQSPLEVEPASDSADSRGNEGRSELPAPSQRQLARPALTALETGGLRPPLAGYLAGSPPTTPQIARVLDAAANRAREGLRVVEDYARFVLDDGRLTEVVKVLRHELAAALARLPLRDLLAARDAQRDVGIGLTTDLEQRRDAPAGVLSANCKRVQESLRSLEEFGKLVDAPFAAQIKQLRYRAYQLESELALETTAFDLLANARLYVLIDGRSSVEEFSKLAASLIGAGAEALQLRDKRLTDRDLIGRARILRELTRGSNTLFIVNDRPDLAALTGADGVHVGQEELGAREARSIVGPGRLVGVSTHSLDQAQQAVRDGADYIGVGPTFPSDTKEFSEYPGLELLRSVAASIRVPAFAIGGITLENLQDVLATGFSRVAVASAISQAEDPAAAVRAFVGDLGTGGHGDQGTG